MAEFFGVQLPERCECVLGGAGTGKTQKLVHEAAAYAAAGEDTLVLAASSTAAEAFTRRLGSVCAEGISRVTVCTAQDIALQILATDEAVARTGRKARILTNFEHNVLMEDMKTSGMRAKRLKEMLKFFFRSKTEMVDDDPDWAYTEEEVEINTLLQACLKSMRAYLPCEVSNVAVNMLRSESSLLDRFGRTHVLVDDFQALSKASQILSAMLAQGTLTVAGDTYAGSEVFEQYPYLEGLYKYAGLREVAVQNLATSPCGSAVVAGLNSLRAEIDATLCSIELAHLQDVISARMDLTGRAYEECKLDVLAENPGIGAPAPNPEPQQIAISANSGAGRIVLQECKTPSDEAEWVSGCIAAAIESGIKPEDVFLAVPNRVWNRSIRKALAEKGIRSVEAFEPQAFNGDIRDLARSEAARVLTLIRLAADPTDAAALRTWCSFGDWLANSTAFAVLRRACDIADITFPWALEALADSDTVEACKLFNGIELGVEETAALDRVKEAYVRAKASMGKLTGLSGDELVEAATDEALGEGCAVPKAFAQFGTCIQDFSSLDARGLCDVLDMVMRAPALPHIEGMVTVGTVDQVCGISCKLLVVTGFVNGFIPSHAYFDVTKTNLDRMPHIHANDVRRVYAVLGKSSGDVVVTSFTQLDALQAERLGVKIDRIRALAGARVAKVSTSEIADFIKA